MKIQNRTKYKGEVYKYLFQKGDIYSELRNHSLNDKIKRKKPWCYPSKEETN